MATQNGTDIILMVDGERFAAATANEISLSRAIRDTTNKDTNGWKENEYGLGEGTMNGTGLFLTENKNLLSYSEDFTNSAWVKSGLTIAGRVEGPTGLKNGFNTSGATLGDAIVQELPVNLEATTTYMFSLWVKGSGNISMTLGDSDDSNTEPATLTSTWTRISVEYTTTSGAGPFVIIQMEGTVSLSIAQPMLEIGNIVTAYKPSGRLYNYFANAIKNKTKLQCIITNQLDYTLSGQCLVSNLALTAPMEENTTFTADFNLSGIITQGTI